MQGKEVEEEDSGDAWDENWANQVHHSHLFNKASHYSREPQSFNR